MAPSPPVVRKRPGAPAGAIPEASGAGMTAATDPAATKGGDGIYMPARIAVGLDGLVPPM
jgi:hypothetical protein